MLAVGNKKHHLIWEARRPRTKPTPTSTREEREAFIRAKYISKEYLYDLPPSSKHTAEVTHVAVSCEVFICVSPSQLLLTEVKSGDIVGVMKMLPYARQEDVDRVHGPPVNATALHVACSEGNTSIVQLLIWVSSPSNPPSFIHQT